MARIHKKYTKKVLFTQITIGGGNGSPLLCSCLENPRDGGAWWAAVCGVTQSQTRLKQLSSNHDGLVELDQCHLKPDILECEFTWTLGNMTTNKASGRDRFPAELFQIVEDDVKMLHSVQFSSATHSCLTLCDPMNHSTPGLPVPQNVTKFGKLSSGHRTGKGQFSFISQRGAMPKNVQTTVQLCSFHMLAG